MYMAVLSSSDEQWCLADLYPIKYLLNFWPSRIVDDGDKDIRVVNFLLCLAVTRLRITCFPYVGRK